MSETTAILLTLVVYKVALLAIGWFASSKTHDVSDYFLGGRTLGPWVTAISASASSSSAWTLLGVSGYAYANGLSAIWIVPACIGGFALNWFVLAPALRRRALRDNALTVTDILAGPRDAPGSMTIRRVATAVVLLSLLAYVASQFQGAGKTFAETFEMSMTSSVLVGSAIVVVYTLMGGFLAVSITDTVQGIVMALASIALPVAAVLAVGGLGALAQGLADVGVEGFGSWTRGLETSAGVGMVLGLLGIGLGYPGQPHVVNRYMAVRDERSLRRARVIAMVWACIMYVGMVVLGWAARVALGTIGDAEVAFVAATRAFFHPVAAGVMLAAVLSAIMSTADSQLLVAASSVAHDIEGPQTVNKDPATALRRSRQVVFGLSVAAVGLALWGEKSIFDKVLFAWNAMGAAFGPLLLVEVLGRPRAASTRLAAIVLGFASAVILYWIHPTDDGSVERVAPFSLALAVAWLGPRQPQSSSSLGQPKRT